MKTPYTSTFAIATLLAGLHALPVAAQGNVIFLGADGYAQMCSEAAHTPDRNRLFEQTGSRLLIPGLEVCTLAIQQGDLTVIDLAGSYVNRGVLHFSAGDHQLALQDFDAALGLTQELPEAFVNRGYALVALERWAESLAAFDRGIELGAPDLARAHFNRAIAHEELGQLREAYADYLKASELNPEWEEAKRELSRFRVR